MSLIGKLATIAAFVVAIISIGLSVCIFALILAISELVAKIRGGAISAQSNEAPPKPENNNVEQAVGEQPPSRRESDS